MFDGPIVLAGGISDGRALKAAQVLGCDLAYMGRRFHRNYGKHGVRRLPQGHSAYSNSKGA
jgi:isopentenyl diphosphate isomerase/L-lactate dehydrogenase-like FMN-dependent dehydrogenase